MIASKTMKLIKNSLYLMLYIKQMLKIKLNNSMFKYKKAFMTIFIKKIIQINKYQTSFM